MDRYPYDFNAFEEKWQQFWQRENLFQVDTSSDGNKFYCLMMFPYPSGELHVGHSRNYTFGDVMVRYRIMKGLHVLSPMGWDSFGLPAENAAIKRKIHPAKYTYDNIARMKKLIKRAGFGYDWDKEFATCDKEYYRWTQWIFLQMYKKGLAYRKMMPINWCPSCKTGLANEEVVGGTCERCGHETTKKNLMQWMLRITDYAERLLADLDKLDWPENVKKMQANWIGKSIGAEADFDIVDSDKTMRIFTTRPDTLYGATYMVVAPEHPILNDIVPEEKREEVQAYIEEVLKKSSVERMATEKVKTGVFTGAYAINPVNGEKIPVWVSEYVLIDYGTGAIMSVPAHDERDFEFAKKFDLPIRRVIAEYPETADEPMEEAYTGEGIMINSDEFNGILSEEGKSKVVEKLHKQGKGIEAINYKLRDWVFSRQRYWGEPIPIIFCEKCGEVPVPEEDLPVVLPDVEHYEPTGTGQSPLAVIPEFVNTTCPKCGGPANRETNTMPQWAGSCWYFLRYPDAHNDKEAWDKEIIDRWLPVDLYVGGIEHAILHLLYARFFTKFLYDCGYVGFDEPFGKLFNQGMIYKDGAKMSKSKGNVVGLEEIINKYGADTLRLYILFTGPPDKDLEWKEEGVLGVNRFLYRLWETVFDVVDVAQNVKAFEGDKSELTGKFKEVYIKTHQTIEKVTDGMEKDFHLNTSISTVMELVNLIREINLSEGLSEKEKSVVKKAVESAVMLLGPIVPHITEELWQVLGHTESLFNSSWPIFDPAQAVADQIEMPVQISGKVRSRVVVDKGISEDELKRIVLEDDRVKKYVGQKTIRKFIIVPERLVNIVI